MRAGLCRAAGLDRSRIGAEGRRPRSRSLLDRAPTSGADAKMALTALGGRGASAASWVRTAFGQAARFWWGQVPLRTRSYSPRACGRPFELAYNPREDRGSGVAPSWRRSPTRAGVRLAGVGRSPTGPCDGPCVCGSLPIGLSRGQPARIRRFCSSNSSGVRTPESRNCPSFASRAS